MPKAEVILWQHLRDRQIVGKKFRRQVGIGPFIVDFYCPEMRIVIEIDGDSHFIDNTQEKDRTRDLFLSSRGFRVLRFTNTEIYDNLEYIVEKIAALIENTSRNSSPDPSSQGGGESDHV